MKPYRIAVLPGDGIGPEVIAEGVGTLRAVEQRLDGIHFELAEFSVGAGEYLKNMFGDILSDLAAGLVGGMGMAPSGDIGGRRAVFQPSHAGHWTLAGGAVERVFADSAVRTPDLGDTLTTAVMGQRIREAL